MIPALLDYSRDLRRLLAEGKTLDEALGVLRARGVSALQCIASVRVLRQCGLEVAKQIVSSSSAWPDYWAWVEETPRERP